MPIRPHDIGSWGLFVMYENMLNSSVFEYTGGKRDLALLDKLQFFKKIDIDNQVWYNIS